MRQLFWGFAFFIAAAPAWALDLSDLSNKYAVAGLKQALTDGAGVAVNQLGVKDGFFANPKVKIPLPESLQKVESMLAWWACSSKWTISILR